MTLISEPLLHDAEWHAKEGCDRRTAIRMVIGTAASVVLANLMGETANAATLPALKAGDIVLTRNSVNNIVPGFWNHTAIFSGSGSFIEGQAATFTRSGDVRLTDYSTFVNRYPTIAVLRWSNSTEASRMASAAKLLVGRPYSLTSKYGSGSCTCVSLVRAAFQIVRNSDPGWIIPDHVLTTKGFTKQ